MTTFVGLFLWKIKINLGQRKVFLDSLGLMAEWSSLRCSVPSVHRFLYQLQRHRAAETHVLHFPRDIDWIESKSTADKLNTICQLTWSKNDFPRSLVEVILLTTISNLNFIKYLKNVWKMFPSYHHPKSKTITTSTYCLFFQDIVIIMWLIEEYNIHFVNLHSEMNLPY